MTVAYAKVGGNTLFSSSRMSAGGGEAARKRGLNGEFPSHARPAPGSTIVIVRTVFSDGSRRRPRQQPLGTGATDYGSENPK